MIRRHRAAVGLGAPLVYVVAPDTDARAELVDQLLGAGYAVAAFARLHDARRAVAQRPPMYLLGDVRDLGVGAS